MFKNFFTNKKRATLSILAVLSIVSIIWIIASVNKGGGSKVTTTTPPPTKFELIRTIPASGAVSTFPVTSSVELYFTKSIDINTLVLTSIPKTNLLFDTNSNKTVLYIRAKNGWLLDTDYKISVNIMSIDKESLPEKIIIDLKVVPPTSSIMSEIPVSK